LGETGKKLSVKGPNPLLTLGKLIRCKHRLDPINRFSYGSLQTFPQGKAPRDKLGIFALPSANVFANMFNILTGFMYVKEPKGVNSLKGDPFIGPFGPGGQ
jgi:hypothetical protein